MNGTIIINPIQTEKSRPIVLTLCQALIEVAVFAPEPKPMSLKKFQKDDTRTVDFTSLPRIPGKTI